MRLSYKRWAYAIFFSCCYLLIIMLINSRSPVQKQEGETTHAVPKNADGNADTFGRNSSTTLSSVVAETPADTYKVIRHALTSLNAFWSKCIDKRITLKDRLRELERGHPYRSSRDAVEHFFNEISNCEMYPVNSTSVDKVLNYLQSESIIKADSFNAGTQVKLLVTLRGGKKAVLKPLRHSPYAQIDPNVFYWREYERSFAEIAAFHLDRLLDFRQAPPTTGRIIDVRDIKRVATKRLKATFFTSPAKNMCFTSKCDYYCDSGHPVCGNPYRMNVSMQIWLPSEKFVEYEDLQSAYRRTYSREDFDQLAEWQYNSSYCEYKVKPRLPYRNGRRLLDAVDTAIFDFLLNNQDRHHYEFMSVFANESFFIHLDNGRGFGRTNVTFFDILAPLYQCCVIRPTTVKTLYAYALATGSNKLSAKLKAVLDKDPTSPVLSEAHYEGLERRLHLIMQQIMRCLSVDLLAGQVRYADVLRQTFEYDNSTGLATDDTPLDSKPSEEDDDYAFDANNGKV